MSTKTPGIQQRARTPLRQVLVQLLALIGAMTLLGMLIGAVSDRVSGNDARGTVVNEDNSPAVGVPVFLDRGGIIERYITDNAGNFRLPLTPYGRERAAWLICAPKTAPMVGYVHGRSHPIYILTTENLHDGDRLGVRGIGWSGPIPRECVHADSAFFWRWPVNSPNAPVPAMPSEPDWSTYRSKP